jgi:hypothetical protein
MELKPNSKKNIIGWREWISLPDLGIPAIKVKVDTGARTSAMHAFAIEEFNDGNERMIRFGVHPLRKRLDIERFCTAKLIDRKRIKDSGGHYEDRYIIRSTAVLGKVRWPIDISLTQRDTMLFRMLLGRKAIENYFMIDPARSYVTGKTLSKSYSRKIDKEFK